MLLKQFEDKAIQIRLDILNAIKKAGKGHIGGSFSLVEILVTLFHGGIINYDSTNPKWNGRDRFILSKGHAGVALYSILSDLGFFSKEELNYINNKKMLGEHPDHFIPGVEILSGSLGHGLSIAAGMALADKFDKKNDRKTFVILGDGECYEGSVWEAANFAAHHKLKNLFAIVDRNKLITHGSTEEINALEPFKDKFISFGWDAYEIDGHNFEDLLNFFKSIIKNNLEKPVALIAKTIKGKGLSFMENNAAWHHGGIDEEKFLIAQKELMERINND